MVLWAQSNSARSGSIFNWYIHPERFSGLRIGDVMDGEEKLEVDDPAEALRNQNGTFKVVSPYGHIFHVTCRRGANMRICEIGKSEAQLFSESRRWSIEKLA